MDQKTTDLATWRAQAERELDEAQGSMDDAQKRLDAARERLALLDRLLLLEGGRPANQATSPNGRPQDFLDACEAVLREAGEPLHISELLTRLKAASVSLPGRGTDANVIVRLRRAEGRFVRTGRGMYALPELGIPEAPTSTKRRRSRKRS